MYTVGSETPIFFSVENTLCMVLPDGIVRYEGEALK